MQVSRDAVINGALVRGAALITISFEFDGTVLIRYHLSAALAKDLGFSKSVMLPLPDQGPAWVDEIQWTAVCIKCFEEARAREVKG